MAFETTEVNEVEKAGRKRGKLNYSPKGDRIFMRGSTVDNSIHITLVCPGCLEFDDEEERKVSE